MRFWRALLLLVPGMLLCLPPLAEAGHYHPATTSIQDIAVDVLPLEAREALRLIRQGGPFPYARDGVVFGNREHRLPSRPRGHYHEYTVKTPGAHDRGPRRIVCGAWPECYYSDDHYRSFRRITGEY